MEDNIRQQAINEELYKYKQLYENALRKIKLLEMDSHNREIENKIWYSNYKHRYGKE